MEIMTIISAYIIIKNNDIDNEDKNNAQNNYDKA